jgi:two-component system sensor histidine kinase VicK
MSIEKHKNNIILKFSDTGVGIAPEDLKHIYKRFYKANKSRSISNSGAGLGLSIAKEIVELHNGTIKINSTLDKGTEVVIIFPAF